MTVYTYQALDGTELTLDLPDNFRPPNALNCFPTNGSPIPVTFMSETMVQPLAQPLGRPPTPPLEP